MPGWLTWAACAPSLEADDPETRRRAVVWMAPDELQQNLPRLVELAVHDPSPEVRREVIVQLGWAGDPAVAATLDQVVTAEPAAVLVAWVGLGACERAARVPIDPTDRAYRWWRMSPCNDDRWW
ncbi:MAG: HEAT repeat domain-containing protein [Myxococcota bacterium]